MATMVVDNRQQSQMSGLGYDPLRGSYNVPHFTNPWVAGAAGTGAPSSHMYATTQATSAGLDSLSQAAQRPTTMSLGYSTLPVTASPLGSGISLPGGQFNPSVIDASQDLMNNSRSYAPQYTAAGPAHASYVPTTAGYPIDYKYGSYGAADRRSSHPSVPSIDVLGNPALAVARGHQRQTSLIDFDRLNAAQRTSFSDAVEASRGMLAMSADITPRNIYGDQGSRSSTSSYGFPSTHSAHSSISSASTYPSYYNGSVAESVSDYSSASESVDMHSRTLPRPSTLMGGLNPPAPQSMMGQFSSKVSSSSQKKHKCKICDKRFTRPSSLQTHMYSHTGEKPFACEVEGCGRHFSVVSNLRRHRKVHKNDGSTRDPGSPEES